MADSNIFNLAQSGTFTDSRTEILRDGAHALNAQAVEAELGSSPSAPISRPERVAKGWCAMGFCPSVRS